MSPFNDETIVLELGHGVGFKVKQNLINYLREQQANISYILTDTVCFISYSINTMLKLTFLD